MQRVHPGSCGMSCSAHAASRLGWHGPWKDQASYGAASRLGWSGFRTQQRGVHSDVIGASMTAAVARERAVAEGRAQHS